MDLLEGKRKNAGYTNTVNLKGPYISWRKVPLGVIGVLKLGRLRQPKAATLITTKSIIAYLCLISGLATEY